MIRRHIPLLVLGAVLLFLLSFGWDKGLQFELLYSYYVEIVGHVVNQPLFSPLVFVGMLTMATTLCLPSGMGLAILGGYLFSPPAAFFYVAFAILTGNLFLFLAIRSSFGNFPHRMNPRWFIPIKRHIIQRQISYLLIARLIPFFPYWLVSTGAAWLHIPLKTYLWTSFFGTLPSVILSVQAGMKMDMNPTIYPSVSSLFNWPISISIGSVAIVWAVAVGIQSKH